MRLFSLHGKLALALAMTVTIGVGVGAVVASISGFLAIAILLPLLILLPLSVAVAGWLTAPAARLLRALDGLVASYRDGDFSLSLVAKGNDELAQLVRSHNALGAALRDQRQDIVQRELMLDTVVQHTPVALILSDPHDKVVYANLAARHLLNDGRSLNGADFTALLAAAPAELREAATGSEDALVPVEIDGSEETFHVSRRVFRLHGRPHRLHLFRRMTRELSRQEVAVWKKMIRVISHELNNSLAPISSMAHSGAELARRGQLEQLPGIFATVGERARHLHDFVAGYARFSKLPVPRPEAVRWEGFVELLAPQISARFVGRAPSQRGWFDRGQIAQALINLANNALEACSAAEAIEIEAIVTAGEFRIEVRDRGSGMSEAVLASALLPFYSTKRSGTGLGLALSREIVEAHGGRIALANREGGGLIVTLSLPIAAAPSS
jgi:nitrogen fixation/metabolism regulation signal transduction histidine kinase